MEAASHVFSEATSGRGSRLWLDNCGGSHPITAHPQGSSPPYAQILQAKTDPKARKSSKICPLICTIYSHASSERLHGQNKAIPTLVYVLVVARLTKVKAIPGEAFEVRSIRFLRLVRPITDGLVKRESEQCCVFGHERQNYSSKTERINTYTRDALGQDDTFTCCCEAFNSLGTKPYAHISECPTGCQ